MGIGNLSTGYGENLTKVLYNPYKDHMRMDHQDRLRNEFDGKWRHEVANPHNDHKADPLEPPQTVENHQKKKDETTHHQSSVGGGVVVVVMVVSH